MQRKPPGPDPRVRETRLTDKPASHEKRPPAILESAPGHGFDKSRNRVFRRFHVHRQAKLPQSRRSNRPNGSKPHPVRSLLICPCGRGRLGRGFPQQRHKISHRGRTGKRNRHRDAASGMTATPPAAVAAKTAESRSRRPRPHPPAPQLPQLTRDHITRDFRPRQQHPLPFYLPPQARHHRLRHILLGHNIHFHAVPLDGLRG